MALAFEAFAADDMVTAFGLFHVLAEKGDLIAQHHLGCCYEQGSGCSIDLARAVHWWKVAAKRGFAESQYAVGYCYERGLGVDVDLPSAFAWYALAADQYHGDAERAMERIRRRLAGQTVGALDA